MDENEPSDGGITILVIEEPEAHLTSYIPKVNLQRCN